MAEQPKKSGGRGAKAGALRRKSTSNRVSRVAAKGGRASKAGAKKDVRAGRLRIRRNEAAYARVAEEYSQGLRERIQAAVEAGSRIREQIEAKIEKQMHAASGRKAAARKAAKTRARSAKNATRH